MTRPIADTRADFIAFLSQALESEGFPPIAGRMLGLLVFDGEPRSFSELATELGVSRGSISANARHLLARGAIVKRNRPGDRQDYFCIADQSFDSILTELSARMHETSARVQGFAEALPGDAGARSRLRRLSVFYAAMAEGVEQALLRLRNLC